MSKKYALIVCHLFSMSTLAADLYVSPLGSDSNPGSAGAPFKTIQKAASSAKAGTTVHVAPGSYRETITSTNSGTSTARIRYVSDVKWGAKLLPVSDARTMWDVMGGYTDIIGFEVDGTQGNSVRVGVAFSGGNSSMQNSYVHHVAMNSGCDNLGGAGVWAGQHRGVEYSNYDFIGNVIHDVGGGCGYIQGIYHQSSGNIKNNVVYGTSYAIHLYHDDHDVNVVNNTVFGNSGYGIVYGGCQESYTNPCPTKGMRIYNNIVYDNFGGISGPQTSEDVDNIVKNNLVYKNVYQFDLASPSDSTRSGEVIADPQFVNYKRAGGGDYRLKSTSPAINKGISSLAPATDIEGNQRKDGAIDLGAYEYAGTASVPMPAIRSSASLMSFGSVRVGRSSSVKSVTISNTGSAPLTFSKVTMSGNFQKADVGTCKTVLAPGAKCTFVLRFIPKISGTNSGVLSIASNASTSLLKIQLAGTGVR